MQQEAAALQSVAAEGALLADDAARGRSTSVFVRVHAAELSKTARASAALLAEGRTPIAHRLTVLAGRVNRRLDRLSHSGSDRALQRRIAIELEHAARRASSLAGRL